jgi:hypothetical protein
MQTRDASDAREGAATREGERGRGTSRVSSSGLRLRLAPLSVRTLRISLNAPECSHVAAVGLAVDQAASERVTVVFLVVKPIHPAAQDPPTIRPDGVGGCTVFHLQALGAGARKRRGPRCPGVALPRSGDSPSRPPQRCSHGGCGRGGAGTIRRTRGLRHARRKAVPGGFYTCRNFPRRRGACELSHNR